MMTPHEPMTCGLRLEHPVNPQGVVDKRNRYSGQFSIAMLLVISSGVAVNKGLYGKAEDPSLIWTWLSLLFFGVVIGQGMHGHRSKAAWFALSFWLSIWLGLHVSAWLLDLLT